MTTYLWIETRSAWESNEVPGLLDLVAELSRTGHHIDLLLIQNAVLMARRAGEPRLAQLVEQPNMTIWVDDFALRTRAVPPEELCAGIHVIGMDKVVQLLTRPGCKPIWH